MAYTVEDVITNARDQHAAFDPERTPDTILLRELNRYVRRLVFLISERDSSRFADETNVTLPLSVHDDGVTLPAFVIWQGASLNCSQLDAQTELKIVPYRKRHEPGVAYPAYIHGGVLYLIGNEEDWSQFDSLDYSLVPEPTPLAALGDTVVLPESALEVCSGRLAFYMARRTPVYENAPMPYREFGEWWKESEADFLVEMATHNRTEENYIREVW